MCAREIIKLGLGNNGYWNNARFLKQMDMALKIADIKYPSDKYSKAWVFDQSSGQCTFREEPSLRELNECGFRRCSVSNERHNAGWKGAENVFF